MSAGDALLCAALAFIAAAALVTIALALLDSPADKLPQLFDVTLISARGRVVFHNVSAPNAPTAAIRALAQVSHNEDFDRAYVRPAAEVTK